MYIIKPVTPSSNTPVATSSEVTVVMTGSGLETPRTSEVGTTGSHVSTLLLDEPQAGLSNVSSGKMIPEQESNIIVVTVGTVGSITCISSV